MSVLLTIVLLTASVYPSEYEPLSDKEVEKWLRSISLEQLIDFVKVYHFIENTSANVKIPPASYILADSDLYITYQEPVVIRIAHLHYEFEIEDEIIKDFYTNKKKENRKRNIRTGIIIGIVSFLGGGLVFAIASN